MVQFDLVFKVQVVSDDHGLKMPLDRGYSGKGGLVGLAINPATEA